MDSKNSKVLSASDFVITDLFDGAKGYFNDAFWALYVRNSEFTLEERTEFENIIKQALADAANKALERKNNEKC
jgi:hypothetical protein